MIDKILAHRFHERFLGLPRAYGTYAVQEREGQKMKGQARTLVGQVTDTLWLGHLEGFQGIGITPIDDESLCRWGAIDIDVYNGLSLENLERQIEEHKLPLLVCTTKSGGAHLFLFLSEPVEASLVRDRLSQWAYLLGHPNVEVFPKQVRLASANDVGSWLNMPYFEAENSTRKCVRAGRALTAVEFLDLADAIAVTRAELAAFTLAVDPLLAGAPPCLIYLCRFGIPPGGRNNGLFQLAIYAKKRWPDDWETKLRELNSKFLDPPLPTREVETIRRSLHKKEYAYKCGDPPMKGVCDKALCKHAEWGISGGQGEEGPGVTMTDLAKLDTRPPIWFLTIEDKRVCVLETRILLDQQHFSRLCVDEVHILPHAMKAPQWRELVQTLLDNVEIIEVPQDAGVDGVLFDLVESFVTESPCGVALDDLLNGTVYKENGTWFFRSRDLLHYLETNKFPQREPNRLWARLKGLGGEAGEQTVKGKRIRYWCLPEGRFTAETEDREPRIEKREF